jgi:hypothetical protein
MFPHCLLGIGLLFTTVVASPRPAVELEQRQNSATDRSVWGEYSTDTNYYTTVFSTGVTREVR